MEIGRTIILFGVVLVIVGLIITFLPSIPKLPGDIYIKRDNFTVYIPIVTSVVISLILTLIFNLISRR